MINKIKWVFNPWVSGLIGVVCTAVLVFLVLLEPSTQEYERENWTNTEQQTPPIFAGVVLSQMIHIDEELAEKPIVLGLMFSSNERECSGVLEVHVDQVVPALLGLIHGRQGPQRQPSRPSAPRIWLLQARP